MHSCWVAFAKMAPTSKTIHCANGFDWAARSTDNDAVAEFGQKTQLVKASPIVAAQAAAAAQRPAAAARPATPVRSE